MPADVYALGLIFFEVLCGRPWVAVESPGQALHQIVHDPPPEVDDLCPGLAPAWVELLRAMLHKDPLARPSAGEVQFRLATLEM
jgi:serine/threonine protein kinase